MGAVAGLELVGGGFRVNYLFVMPRYRKNRNDNYTFPLGMAYVSASLKQARKNVFCLNLNVSFGEIEEEVKNAISRYDIDVIATGGLSPNFKQIRTIISCAKKMKPEIITMAGGGLVTATPEVIMRGIPELDIGMIAEGEITIKELAETFEHSGDLKSVRGIIYRESDGTLVRTSAREDIEDLDALPFPDYEGFQFDGTNVLSICTSRSCPYNCTFCFHTCGKKYRCRSMDSIFQEIDWLVQKYDIKHLDILDELFSIDIVRMTAFCKRIREYGIGWSCQMRVDRISTEMLYMMKQSGCRSISFGIESADNRILKSMEKNITIEEVEKAIGMSREAGICPFGNLLLGDKNDDVESFQKCLDWYQSHPDIRLGFNKVLVLPGSKLYQYAVQNGYIKDEVKYLEEENFAINITKMSDLQYKECVEIMDEVVARREYPLIDEKILNYDRRDNKVLAKGKCPLCGKEIKMILRDCFAIINSGSCPECGRPYTINLYNMKKPEMDERLREAWEGKTVVIWGLGIPATKFVYQSELALWDNVWFVDKNFIKQRKMREGKIQVYPIEKLEEIKADIILTGTDVPVTDDIIRKYAREKYPNTKVIGNLNEYIFEILGGDLVNATI